MSKKEHQKNTRKSVFGMSSCLAFLCLAFMTSCDAKKENLSVYSWEEAVSYEAEEAVLLGNTAVENSQAGYSGLGYVAGLATEEDGIEFVITIEETGFYDLNFVSASGGDYKENYVLADGEAIGCAAVESSTFTDSVVQRVYLEAGEHRIQYMKYWGWVMVDCLKIKKSDDLDPARFEVSRQLVNENATENTKRLYNYLCDMYGTYIISGQYSEQGMYGMENAAIWKATGGDYPAILGMDLIEYTPSRVANGSVGYTVDHAIDYWNEGGIVTFCWHWNAPEKYLTGQWYSGFYTEYTNIDLGKIMNGEDPEGYELLMRDIDAIAVQLQRLQDAGVPILWRPLHEAGGGWFWWGASGPEAYKELYILLYDKLTNEYGLNNLIWVWNGQDAEWYPGDEYVDIIGEDLYPGEQVYTPQTDTYLQALQYTDANKMIVMSENGCLFDPELARRDGSMWGYFCTWEGEFVLTNSAFNTYSEKYTELEMLQRVYADEFIITRSELPDLTTYPISE